MSKTNMQVDTGRAANSFLPTPTARLMIGHKCFILVFLPLCLGLFFVCSLLQLIDQADKNLEREAQVKQLETKTGELSQQFFDVTEIMMTYGVTHEPVLLDRCASVRKQLNRTYDDLRKLAKDDPVRLRVLEHLDALNARSFELLEKTSKDPSTFGMADVIGRNGLHNQLQRILTEFVSEQKLLRDSQKESFDVGQPAKPAAYAERAELFILYGALATIPMGIFLLALFSRGISSKLEIVMDNARRLSSGQLLNPTVPGADEIARLDRAFHNMAQALKEAEEKKRAILENAFDVICALDAKNHFTKVSQASSSVWGYAPDELIGQNLADVVIAEDISETLFAQQLSVVRSGVNCQNRVRRKDDSIIDMLWSINWSQEEMTYFCVAHDITERKAAEDLVKESEERIREIVELMPIALVIGSANGVVEMINVKAQEMFGLTPEQIVGGHLKQLFEKFHKVTDDEFMTVLEEQWLGQFAEVDAKKSNGTTFPFELSITDITVGGTSKLLTIGLDGTERHEIERWKQELLQMVSHDLRTPLTSLRGALSLLLTDIYGKLNASGVSMVESCDSEINRVIVLIEELLDLEKFQAGKMQMEFEVVDMSSIVERSVNTVAHLAERSGIKIETVAKVVEGFADSCKLLHVLVNLLTNAIKFSPPNSTIRVGYEDLPGLLEVTVTDEGPGIPLAQRASLFDRFKKSDVGDDANFEHREKGLGLLICKSIVEAHRGTIGVKSEEGKGSTFWFRIPVPE